MECQKCTKQFESIHIDGDDYHYCNICEAIYLHKNQLNALMRDANEDVELHSIKEYAKDQSNPLQCPECLADMKKINFLGYSGIVIDHCEICDSFLLSKEEISQMHELIAMVEDGRHTISEARAYNLIAKISEMAYSVFH